MQQGPKAMKILDAAHSKHIYTSLELAQRMGWCYATCSNKINNPSKMTLAEAKRLSKLTGLSLEYLSEL